MNEDQDDGFDFLPTKDTEEAEIERKKLWKRIDMNGNGRLSLSEINSTFNNISEFKILAKYKEA